MNQKKYTKQKYTKTKQNDKTQQKCTNLRNYLYDCDFGSLSKMVQYTRQGSISLRWAPQAAQLAKTASLWSAAPVATVV